MNSADRGFAAIESQSEAHLSGRWFLLWGLAWLIPFSVFRLLLVPAGFGLFESSWVSGLFYLLATAIAAMIFHRQLPKKLDGPGWLPVLALGSSALTTLAASFWLHQSWPISEQSFARYQALQIGVIRMDSVYYAGKLPELLFQQTMIYILVRRLERSRGRGLALIAWFALIFGGIHLPIIVMKGLAGVAFVLAATGAALVFPPLITRFHTGAAYSFCSHLMAYTITGVVLRVVG